MSKKVVIEVSARHIHLSKELVDILFGKDYELTPEKWLSQPGQFLAKERINIKGPKGELKDVAILGPIRELTQLELSITDSRHLGVGNRVEKTGDIHIIDKIMVYTKQAEISLTEEAIIAQRHIHVSLKEAKEYGLLNKQLVSVKVSNVLGRSLIFLDVIVRVDENYSFRMHIDTDEANAAFITGSAEGEIITEDRSKGDGIW